MLSGIRTLFSKKNRPKNTETVQDYWTRHVVNDKIFADAQESLKYLEYRSGLYPFFSSFMNLYNDVSGKTVVDYGSGPGEDVIGFVIHGKAKKVYGVDVSPRGHQLCRDKLKLHNIPDDRVDLIQVSDKSPEIPIASGSIDHIYSQGVLHHTAFPQELLNEFYRILKPGGTSRIMVYNRDSLWLHLYTAFVRIIEQKAFNGLNAYEAFGMNTDGVECPISVCYSAPDFLAMLEKSGFSAKYLGGYYSDLELELFKTKLGEALNSPKLGQTHKEFLSSLRVDSQGFPHRDGVYVGIGGSYVIQKQF